MGVENTKENYVKMQDLENYAWHGQPINAPQILKKLLAQLNFLSILMKKKNFVLTLNVNTY